MAIADDIPVQPADPASPIEAPVRRKPRVLPRLAFGFLLGLALVGGATAAGLYAWDRSYEGRILPGVSAAGLDLTGLDRAQATAALDKAYDAVTTGRVVVETEAGDVSVPYAQFGRHVDTAAMADAALRAGRDGTTAERALGEIRLALNGQAIQPTLVFDPAALAARVDEALSRLDRAPVDAQIVKGTDGTYTIPAQMGRSFNGTAAASAALTVVGRLDAPAEVRVPALATVIQPALTDVEVETAKVAAEHMDGKLVVSFRGKDWKLKGKKIRKWISFAHDANGSVQPVVDTAAIAKALKPVAKGVKRAPMSAVYFKSRGRVIGVAPAKNVLRLDVKATAAAIAAALAERGKGGAPAPVNVKVAQVPPKLTTEQAVKKGPLLTRLGMWKTWFPVSDHNFFGANIWQPAKNLDGMVLFPGQRFEWWSAIGPVSTSTGFGPGGFIAGDHTEPTGALGGGMCSSSTTLFNAAMRAGMQMGARSNHKYYISRYPLGLDATVSKMPGGGGQTMSFTNDMKHPIAIRTFRYTAGGIGWVQYEIWGIPDGRTVTLSHPSVSGVVKATTRVEYVTTLPRGVREQTEYPSNRMDVSVSRVVRRGGRILHHDLWVSHYVLWNGVIQVGR